MNILFYSSFNSRARDAESLMLAFKNQGHDVISLTQASGNDINSILIASGVKALSYEVQSKYTIWFVLKHLYYLIRLCWRESIDIIYCHLEAPSFIGVLSQFFIRPKVYICRHHIDEAKLYGFDQSISYKLTYRLARQIIVVSNHAKEFMVADERIPSKKIIHINLAYDFSLFTKPDTNSVDRLKKKYMADILLLCVGRLTEFKRPNLSIDVLKSLLQRQVNAKLIILGSGPMNASLNKMVADQHLCEKVFFEGRVPNVLDYMAASDFLIHPSVLESSCVVVKEAGLTKLPVIVCKGIGDFDDYLIHTENGFLVNENRFVDEATWVIETYSHDKEKLTKIGEKLSQGVRDFFNITNVLKAYDKIHCKTHR